MDVEELSDSVRGLNIREGRNGRPPSVFPPRIDRPLAEKVFRVTSSSRMPEADVAAMTDSEPPGGKRTATRRPLPESGGEPLMP